MQFQTYDHLHACALLEHHAGLKTEVTQALARVPVPIWPGKSKSNSKLEVVQPVLNTCIELAMTEAGWAPEPEIAPGEAYFADFFKEVNGLRVLIEVQFANSARTAMDVCKFRIGWQRETVDVAISVVMMKQLANLADSNVANFEDQLKLMKSLGREGLPVPTWVIGLQYEGAKVINIANKGFRTVKALTGPSTRENKLQLAQTLLAKNMRIKKQ